MNNVRLVLAAAAIAMLILFSATSIRSFIDSQPSGTEALTLSSISAGDGKGVDVSKYLAHGVINRAVVSGKPILLALMGSCAGCQTRSFEPGEELPRFSSIVLLYEGLPVDLSPAARDILKKQSVASAPLQVGFDIDGSVHAALRAAFLPRLYVVGSDGTVVSAQTGNLLADGLLKVRGSQ